MSDSYEWKSIHGFQVDRNERTQCDYMLIAVDVVGRAYTTDNGTDRWWPLPSHPEAPTKPSAKEKSGKYETSS